MEEIYVMTVSYLNRVRTVWVKVDRTHQPRKFIESRVIEPKQIEGKAKPTPFIRKGPKDEENLCNGCLLQGSGCVNCGELPPELKPFSMR